MADETDILIVGAGAARLAAARELSAANLDVIVLEARDRIGGRIHTHSDPQIGAPVELGAEFVHGKPADFYKSICVICGYRSETNLRIGQLAWLH